MEAFVVPVLAPALALLQSGGGNPWGPLTLFAVALYGSGVVLCFVIAGHYLVMGSFDTQARSKGVDWLRRGAIGGVFGSLASSIYLLFDKGLF